MLKLVYDVRCGFKELYITEKDCEWDLGESLVALQDAWNLDTSAPTEDQLFEQYKSIPELLLEEVFDGVEECIEEVTVEECGHTYFKHICFEDKDRPYLPGYFKMYNLRLVKVDGESEQVKKKYEDYLKAEDVMTILGISRQTLSNWVKRGLIETNKTATGRYIYDAESVYKLKEGK